MKFVRYFASWLENKTLNVHWYDFGNARSDSHSNEIRRRERRLWLISVTIDEGSGEIQYLHIVKLFDLKARDKEIMLIELCAVLRASVWSKYKILCLFLTSFHGWISSSDRSDSPVDHYVPASLKAVSLSFRWLSAFISTTKPINRRASITVSAETLSKKKRKVNFIVCKFRTRNSKIKLVSRTFNTWTLNSADIITAIWIY